MKKYLSFFVAFSTLLLCSCGGMKQKDVSQSDTDSLSDVSPRYAKGYTVKLLDNGVRLIDVADPQDDEDRMPVDYHFALVQKGVEVDVPAGYTKVEVPVERTLVMTMLQLSNFTALDAHDVVRGITGTKNLFNDDIRQRVKDGRMVKIGMEGNFDTELILAAHPEVIFISPFKRGGYDAIKETGITLIPHLGYKELTPLGQAEWIRFVGMFIGKEHEADSIFAGIESRYNTLKEKVSQCMSNSEDSLPTVFSGKNSLAQIFRDAGAQYVFDNDDTGGVNIEFEQMYAAAANADYWRILNSFEGDFSYDALKSSEPRNELFRAFKEKKVIYCNMKRTPYYEKSPVMPDVLLSDLVAIFHPELMPADYAPTFYRMLK